MNALLALLDLARSNVPLEALPKLVMSDPGSQDYVAAYAALICDRAVLETVDENGLPFLLSFDVTECLRLSHSRSHNSEVNRWFSILAGCLELLGAGESRGFSRSSSLSQLRADGEALGSTEVASLVASIAG